MLIFKARLTSERQKGTLYAFAVDLQGRCDWRVMTNELEGALVEGWPEIGEGLRILRSSHPTPVSLSGSGAASFAVFDNPEAARRAAAELPAICSFTWAQPCGADRRGSRSEQRVMEVGDEGD